LGNLKHAGKIPLRTVAVLVQLIHPQLIKPREFSRVVVFRVFAPTQHLDISSPIRPRDFARWESATFFAVMDGIVRYSAKSIFSYGQQAMHPYLLDRPIERVSPDLIPFRIHKERGRAAFATRSDYLRPLFISCFDLVSFEPREYCRAVASQLSRNLIGGEFVPDV
jgi:hypothetical protein